GEESARAWRAALVNAAYLEQAAAYALAPAPNEIRDAIRAQCFAPPLLVSARRALATLEAAWGSPANGWLALRDLPPDSTSAAAWLDFAQRAEAEERWTHAREALAGVLRWRPSPDIALRAAIAALNSGDPGGALALAPLTSGRADSASRDTAGWLALYASDIRTARRLLRTGGDASPELALALALISRVTVDSSVPLGQAFLTLARGDTVRAATAMVESSDRLPE